MALVDLQHLTAPLFWMNILVHTCCQRPRAYIHSANQRANLPEAGHAASAGFKSMAGDDKEQGKKETCTCFPSNGSVAAALIPLQQPACRPVRLLAWMR